MQNASFQDAATRTESEIDFIGRADASEESAEKVLRDRLERRLRQQFLCAEESKCLEVIAFNDIKS